MSNDKTACRVKLDSGVGDFTKNENLEIADDVNMGELSSRTA
jgi:hypothetical protein